MQRTNRLLEIIMKLLGKDPEKKSLF